MLTINYLRNKLVKTGLIFLFMIAGTYINAQQIRHLSIAEGLNGRQAFNFVQDKEGFIWISNRFGVDRYDGKKIKNYLFPILNGVKNPMREVYILLDKDSVLWAYTDNGGLYFYNEKTDKFQSYKNLKFYLKTVFFDQHNTLWFGTNNSFGKHESGKTTIISHPELQSQLVRRILKYDDKKLMVVSTKSIHIYNIENNVLSNFLSRQSEKMLSTLQIESAYYDILKKELWIGTTNSGIIVYSEKTKTFQKINTIYSEYDPILSIYPLDKNHLFFGTDGIGALLLDKNTRNIVQIYKQKTDGLLPLSGNAIYDVFKDKEGRIWMSTYSDGVNIIESKKEGFNTIRNEKNNENSILTNVATSIIEDADNNIWFGTNNGLSFWNKKTNKWRHLFISKIILTLFQDSQKNIWVGTYSWGVYVLDKRGNILKHYQKLPNNNNTIGTNFIYALFEDSEKNMWIGGIKGALTKFDRKTQLFKSFNLYQVNSISQFSNNELLVANVNGLHFVSTKTGKISAWKYNDNLKSKCVFNILRESPNEVWITSYGGGLSKCNLKTGLVRNYTQKNGMATDIVYAVLKDEKHNLWISSESGIIRINTKTNFITNYSTGDGISDMSFRPFAAMKSKTGEIYFGSYNGVTYFYPEQIFSTQAKSKLVFLDFSLFNKVTHPGDKNSPLTDKINNLQELDLSYRDHSFSLNFTTINFAPNAKRRYMWKLEGLDKDWVGPSSETVVNYTNLKPDTYVFKLKAIGDNNMVLDQRELKIVIHPPFWNTFIAKIIGFILLVLFAYWAYKYLSNLYEKRRTTEKIKFFINTTHDLRTPLTLISSPIYELKEKLVLDEWNKYLFDLVTSNLEKMNKMVSQLLDFQKSYEAEEYLMVTKNNLNTLLTEKKMFWEPVAQRKNISILLHLPENHLFEWYDKQKMDKILDNLISNAIKYSRNDGTVDISLTYTSSHWQINVSDNGIGIPESAARKLFNRFYRAENAINSQETGSGLGLLLIKNYVSMHRGQTGVSSYENEGSDFYIRLKRGYKHYRNTELIDEGTYSDSHFETSTVETENIDKQKIKLLIVEDNPDLREYINMSLGHYFTTYTAENGKAAWEKIPTINPDIVLSDYNMPEMNGFELCEKIKKTYETSHIPVILLTVMSDIKNMEEGYKLGADDYIPKPFDVKYLKLKIENIIANRKILRTKFLETSKPVDLIETADNEHNVAFLSKATKIVDDHIIDTDFSISDFAREMGMSKSLLYTKFNAVTGYSPNDFVKITRMKKAISLFKEGRYNINEVAAMTGFDEASYFTTSFKKIYGKSPKQFIKENIADNNL